MKFCKPRFQSAFYRELMVSAYDPNFTYDDTKTYFETNSF